MTHNDWLSEQLKLYKRERDQFKEENKELKQRITNLVKTNTTLQNDLFSEQLIQDETEEYINQLKNELFNLYLKHQTRLHFV